jgi:L-fuculose-phosphate aldolase
MIKERQHREEIVRYGRMIHERGYVAATDGNLSVRLDEKRVLMTPTSMCKGMMTPSDLVIVDKTGKKLAGRRDVSSEMAMHLLIYRMRPDIKAIVHAHPPTATGYAAAGMPLNEALISEVVICLGAIPLAKYGTPGTPELTDALEPLIPEYDAILMSNHGVVSYGEDLQKAYMKMETVEHFAKVALVAHQLGRQQVLSKEDVEKLLVVRRKYAAVNSAAPMRPGSGNNGTQPVNGAGSRPGRKSNQQSADLTDQSHPRR